MKPLRVGTKVRIPLVGQVRVIELQPHGVALVKRGRRTFQATVEMLDQFRAGVRLYRGPGHYLSMRWGDHGPVFTRTCSEPRIEHEGGFQLPSLRRLRAAQ